MGLNSAGAGGTPLPGAPVRGAGQAHPGSRRPLLEESEAEALIPSLHLFVPCLQATPAEAQLLLLGSGRHGLTLLPRGFLGGFLVHKMAKVMTLCFSGGQGWMSSWMQSAQQGAGSVQKAPSLRFPEHCYHSRSRPAVPSLGICVTGPPTHALLYACTCPVTRGTGPTASCTQSPAWGGVCGEHFSHGG